MNNYLWWILSFFLICALSATEVFVCSVDENGEYVCKLISDPDPIVYEDTYDY